MQSPVGSIYHAGLYALTWLPDLYQVTDRNDPQLHARPEPGEQFAQPRGIFRFTSEEPFMHADGHDSSARHRPAYLLAPIGYHFARRLLSLGQIPIVQQN